VNEIELEQALRRALRPVDPGQAFTDRVLERLDASTVRRTEGSDVAGAIAASGSPPEQHRPHRRVIRWARVALAACAIVGIGLVHLRQGALQRQRGLDARAQLLQALSIASANINVVRAAVISQEEPMR